MDSGFQILLSVIFVILPLALHAALVVSEISLVKFRYGEVEEDIVSSLRKRRWIGSLMENSEKTGRVVRFGKTLCTVAFGLLLLLLVGDLLGGLGERGTPDRILVGLIAFGVAVLVHFFFAEILPRGFAMRDPVVGIRRTYWVLVGFQIVTFPAMLFFRHFKKLLYRRMGVDAEDELNPLDLDVQIRALGEDSNMLTPVVRRIVDRALQVQELVVQDILLPRGQVVIYDLNEDFSTNLSRMKEAGHTRFPLCRGSLDDCLGIIHIKDIFRGGPGSSEIDPMRIKRTVAVFPLETKVEEALQRMLRAKFHMGLVVDEFGAVVGLVTLESILEELVGDIQDEFDTEEEDIVPLPRRNAFRISGLTPIHDVEERLGIEIDNDEVSTIGGLITGELGRIPERGETLSAYRMRITVEDVDERRVIAATVEAEPADAEEPG